MACFSGQRSYAAGSAGYAGQFVGVSDFFDRNSLGFADHRADLDFWAGLVRLAVPLGNSTGPVFSAPLAGETGRSGRVVAGHQIWFTADPIGCRIFWKFDPAYLRSVDSHISDSVDQHLAGRWINLSLPLKPYFIKFPGCVRPWLRLMAGFDRRCCRSSPFITAYTSLYAALFLGVILLNVLAPRFWCRYVCPLGALLGWLSKVALVRREVAADCIQCLACTRACPHRRHRSQS